MENMNNVNGETYIETLIKVFWKNRSLLSFLFIFSSNFIFDGVFYLICLSYMVELLLRSDITEDDEDDEDEDDEDEDDEHEEVKKMLTDMEHKIHSDLESLRNECKEIRELIDKDYLTGFLRAIIDVTWNKIRDEFISKVNKEVKASMQEFNKDVKSVTDSFHETIKETTKANTTVNEDIKASRETFNKDVKFLTNQLQETCHVIEKTAKEVKIAGETYLNFHIEQSKRVMMIRGEDVDNVSKLREEVRRLSLEAEIVAEELSCATVNLVEAMTQQWEVDNADYLASLPFLNHNH